MSRASFEEHGADTARTFALLGRALRFLSPYRGQVLVKLGLLIVSFLPLLVLPWPIKIVIDHVILKLPIGEQAHPYPPFIARLLQPLEGASPTEILFWVVAVQLTLVVLVGAFGTGGGERDETEAWLSSGHDEATRTENAANAGFSFAGGLLGLLDFRYTMRLTQRINHHYRSRLFERIQTLPMPAFDDERIGDAVYRVMYDTPSITEACYRVVLTPPGAMVAISMAVGIMAVTFGDHPRIYWTALAFAPVALLATLPFAAMLRRRHGEARKAGATTTSTIEEGMTNILAVQSLGGHGREKRRFDSDSWTSFSRFRGVVLAGMLAFLAALVPGIALAASSFLYITDLVIAGKISVGDFTLLFTYFVMILIASVDLGALWIRLQGGAAGLNRVFFLMDLPGETESTGDLPLESVRHGIRVEGVSYTYPDGTEGLHDVSLEAPVGRITALVGPAGAGKTTLAYLIPRFLTPTQGRVCIDGIDVESLDRTSLRAQVAFVFQETSLFDETVIDNIRLGRPDASETEVRRAARMAGVDEFLQDLPQGYQTRLGRAGSKLSVGQKQRLSIARALVRDAPILVLDEPTSALDPETERRLVATLREVRAGRVVLVIAHRLSTIRAADQILFVEEGRILERGSHEELMARPASAYRRYVELQTRGAA
jgi:ABC-type multidrug transport system fused ATPase/permease subunit